MVMSEAALPLRRLSGVQKSWPAVSGMVKPF
jgi:hypothetical protein